MLVTNDFQPNSTSTQNPKPKLNLTVSGFSNESLLNLLDDKYEFNDNEFDANLDETVKDTQDNDMKAAIEDAVLGADVSLMSIKIRKLKDEMKLKVLECTEKDASIESLENENFVLKEDLVKAKDDAKIKDTLNESNLGRMNTLEDALRQKENRVNILEPLVNKLMKDTKPRNVGKVAQDATDNKNDDQDIKKLKLEIKEKNKKITLLTSHKSELANELKDLQEKNFGGQSKDIVDKCIKLTADLSSKKTENKSLEKENKKMVETLADMQTKMNETNNKLAEAQVSNIRLKEFNDQMFELCKGTKLVDQLEKEHAKDLDEQNEVFEKKKVFDSKTEPRKPSPTSMNRKVESKKIERKCWHFENGFCKKPSCNFLHPIEICKYYSKYGQCPQGLVCPLRHPLRICMSYMEGGCHMGDMCVMQHPLNTSPQRTPSSSLLLPSTTTHQTHLCSK